MYILVKLWIAKFYMYTSTIYCLTALSWTKLVVHKYRDDEGMGVNRKRRKVNSFLDDDGAVLVKYK